jgi:hypothetical protein
MNSRIAENFEQIDRKTSRSICDGVGERLRQALRPDTLRPSSHLQYLMDELRKRDGEVRQRASV